MRILATPELRTILASASLVSLTACGVVDEMRDDAPSPTPLTSASAPVTDAQVVKEIATNPDDCLLVVWEGQEERDIAFDRQHDQAQGGAISCATGTSASQFETAIKSIREAARSGNKARMLAEVGIPLMFIDSDGKRRAIADADDIDAAFDEVFDADTLAMLQRIDLSDLTVVAEQKGGFFALGSLWLVVEQPGAKPRIATVNRQAIREAAEAARDEAGAGTAPSARVAG